MAVVEFLELFEEIKEDPRGFVFFPWQGQAGVQKPQDVLWTFHLVSVAPGEVRGNHLHPGHREYLFTFQGTGVLIWEEPPGEVRERLLSGHRTLVRIPPGVAHALRNPGPEMLFLLAWREKVGPESAEPETIFHSLVAGK
jgi:oxalate decarboxylase/phosphoglucose isomerase-like protein (cupin superfamily)